MTIFNMSKGTVLPDAPLFRWLFTNVQASLLWLPLRVWLGYEWLDASLYKISNPAWVTTGEALKGYWLNSLKTEPKTVIAIDWYRDFIQMLVNNQAWTWFAPLVAYGELLIGIGLILGAFTGIAAFFGGVMNWSFMMAGTASTNPLLFIVAISLMMAWRVSGYLGADYFLLRFFGTPWTARPNSPTQPVTT